MVLKREVSALEHERNQAVAFIAWRFSTQDARERYLPIIFRALLAVVQQAYVEGVPRGR